MVRIWSASLALMFAWLVPCCSAHAQPSIPPETREAVVELPRPQQVLPAGDIGQPTPQQIVDALRARGRGAELRRLGQVGNFGAVNAHHRLELIEISGEVRFRLRMMLGPAVNAMPHELGLGEEQAELVVRHYVNQSTELCQKLTQVCDLSVDQWDKLNAAAIVDATRFIRRLRDMFAGTLEEQLARKLNPRDLQQVANRELSLSIRGSSSLFCKVLKSQITPEQRRAIVRWRAAELFSQIDRQAERRLPEQARLLSDQNTASVEQLELYEKLTPQQQDKILELLIGNVDSTEMLIASNAHQQLSSLLAQIEPKQLVEFLTPAQVQAVVQYKTALESRQMRIEEFREVIRMRLEEHNKKGVEGFPAVPNRWELIPVR